MLTKGLIHHISEVLSKWAGTDATISEVSPLGGGSINAAFCVKTGAGNFFLKYNHADRYPGMFDFEKRGLELLRNTNTIRVPEIIATGTFENESYLVLEMVHPGKRAKNYSELLGQALAALHHNTSDYFGLDHDNYIGSLPQQNTFTSTGCDFMIVRRYQPLVKTAFDKNLISAEEASLFDKFYNRLPELLPAEKPALLHGDLWNGNVIPGPDGNAWLIDPAVYYGYRETDIAMAKLFGGFDEAFYSAYHQSYPLQPGWENRIALFQLYPLLVHVVLFGRGYAGQVKEILHLYV